MSRITQTTAPSTTEINELLKEAVVKALCTEFVDVSLSDIDKALRGDSKTKRYLEGITVGDLMAFHAEHGDEEEDAPLRRAPHSPTAVSMTKATAKTKTKTTKPKTTKPKKTEVTLSPPEVPKTHKRGEALIALKADDFDLHVLSCLRGGDGPLSNGNVTARLQDPTHQGVHRRTYIRIQRAVKRLAAKGWIRSFQNADQQWYHESLV